ncbi:MAG: hypothetical protein QXG10_04915 [Candidatus Hadarchaeales archaeon]
MGSHGAAAGLIVAVVVIVALVACLGYFFILRPAEQGGGAPQGENEPGGGQGGEPSISLTVQPADNGDSVMLAWSEYPRDDFVSYVVYQSAVSGDIGRQVTTITNRAKTSEIVYMLFPNTTYYFTVRVNRAGGTYLDSNQASFTTSGGTPSQPGLPHRVLSAASADGLVWVKDNRMVSDRASVPDAVFDGENIRVYFAKWGIRVAISRDGVNWEEKEVNILGIPNGKGAVDPDIVLLPDGNYRMYYYENPMGGGDPAMIPGPHSIYVAVSEDGINFRREREVYAREWITDPDVIQMGNVWRMFVSENAGTTSAISYDNGLSFTFERELEAIDGSVTCTVAVSNGYRMYYHAPETPPRIYSAFSTDGTTWVKDQGVRIEAGAPGSLDENGAEAAAVIRMPDGSYRMYYVSRYG